MLCILIRIFSLHAGEALTVVETHWLEVTSTSHRLQQALRDMHVMSFYLETKLQNVVNFKVIVDPEAQSLVFNIFNFVGLSMWAIQNVKCYIFKVHDIIWIDVITA